MCLVKASHCHVILFSFRPNPESAKIRSMNEQLLTDNITKLLQRVRRTAEKSQYHNSDILVVAVSKTRSAQDIRGAHACGMINFGENYLQEALQKMSELQDLKLVWHFIGPIQSNKTGAIAEHFQWVHSVDREKIARRLSEQRPQHLPPLEVCIQVNVSAEESKAGTTFGALPELAQTIIELPRLRLRGLMAVPAATADATRQRESFSQLREAFVQLRAQCADIDTLSMGMSADLDAAIMEGATVIRVGTAIFGPRNR
jgi:pyridoxal phosphate enzyme (YggS family)